MHDRVDEVSWSAPQRLPEELQEHPDQLEQPDLHPLLRRGQHAWARQNPIVLDEKPDGHALSGTHLVVEALGRAALDGWHGVLGLDVDDPGQQARAHRSGVEVAREGTQRDHLAATGRRLAGEGSSTLDDGEAARYAIQRKQFGQSIAQFGAIKHKLAEIAIREFAVESMLYRTAALIDRAIESNASAAPGEAVLAALEEFAIEASILKVAGSEMIDYAVDENVQIHGGNGFVRDYPAERMYRDARVNRIFEGTNEINRLLIPGMLIRRALKGGLPLIPAAKKLQDEILTPSMAEPPSDEPLENARRTVASLKKVALIVLGTAMQTYGEKLTDEQELLTLASDIIMDVFGAESVVLRAAQMPSNQSSIGVAAAEVYVADAAGRVELAARSALAAMAEGDTLRTLLAALRRVLKPAPVNTVARRREIADAIIERKAYPYM
jgi:hypothetical protein